MLQQAVVVAPDQYQAHYLLGQAYYRLGEEDAAAKEMAMFRKIKKLEDVISMSVSDRPKLHGWGFSALVDVAEPSADGAFYLYADVAGMTNDSQEFCARMLAETGVAATPGVDFDRHRGAGTMRFSFAGTEADMAEGMDRLADWLK